MPAVSSYLYHIGLFVRTQVRYFFSVSIFFGTNSKKAPALDPIIFCVIIGERSGLDGRE